MTEAITGQLIRETVLNVIDERSKRPDPLSSGSIIRVVARSLGIKEGDRESELALMAFMNDLFRMGYLATA